MSSISHNIQEINKSDTMSKEKIEDSLFDFLLENYNEYKNGTLSEKKLEKLNEALPNWIQHVENELQKDFDRMVDYYIAFRNGTIDPTIVKLLNDANENWQTEIEEAIRAAYRAA
ncbi:hypothetical protein [Sulfurimonas sp.]|uniref:hypothetical protein n=1 Tax=Sulfurimonas sp. TaxID=2022749 RepID=UPI002613C130|nr:hypothetical protein [Sulfurimonas sp.]MDD3856005.1 hypothetical protein [Sulfurimonas sp.]